MGKEQIDPPHCAQAGWQVWFGVGLPVAAPTICVLASDHNRLVPPQIAAITGGERLLSSLRPGSVGCSFLVSARMVFLAGQPNRQIADIAFDRNAAPRATSESHARRLARQIWVRPCLCSQF